MSETLDDLDADWPRLWALAERLANATGDGPDVALFPIGLRLNGRYGDRGSPNPTPANGTVFASTGGDGVHFSLLHTTTTPPGIAPVIMTVPMQFDAPNHVVGRSLRDFLALGCRTGYYHLERLAYRGQRQEEINHLEHGEWWGLGWDGIEEEPNCRALLAALIDELQLSQWTDVAQRLAELDAGYLPAVQL